jgi:hypothetical protein
LIKYVISNIVLFRIYMLPYVLPLAHIGLMGSIYSTLAITIERHIAVCHPFLPHKWVQSFCIFHLFYKGSNIYVVNIAFSNRANSILKIGIDWKDNIRFHRLLPQSETFIQSLKMLFSWVSWEREMVFVRLLRNAKKVPENKQ